MTGTIHTRAFEIRDRFVEIMRATADAGDSPIAAAEAIMHEFDVTDPADLVDAEVVDDGAKADPLSWTSRFRAALGYVGARPDVVDVIDSYFVDTGMRVRWSNTAGEALNLVMDGDVVRRFRLDDLDRPY